MLGLLVMPMVIVLQVMRRVLPSLVMPTVRVLLVMELLVQTASALQVMVLGVGPRMGGRRQFWAWALATPGGGPGGGTSSVSLPPLVVLVASGLGALLATPGEGCCW